MGKIFKAILACLILALTTNASSSFDYYSDGIYDSYIQMTKDIKAGLNERQMGEYRHKYLVAANVDNSSSVDIIFYKTIGGKNSLSPQVVKQGGSNKNFLVFDYVERKGDARALQKKLLKYGVRTVILTGGSGFEYTRNPIIIKKLVKDLKHAIRNTPVKVVTIKKIVHSNQRLPSLNAYVGKSKKKVSRKSKKRSSSSNAKTASQYERIKNSFCRKGYVQKKSLVINGKKYIAGKDVMGFTVANIKNYSEGYIAVLLGQNGMYYKLSQLKCPKTKQNKVKAETGKKNTKKKDPVDKKNQPEKVKNARSKAVSRHKKEKHVCDFSKLKVLKNADGKNIKIDTTTYFGKTVTVNTEKYDKYYKVRGSGAEVVILSDRYFKKACR